LLQFQRYWVEIYDLSKKEWNIICHNSGEIIYIEIFKQQALRDEVYILSAAYFPNDKFVSVIDTATLYSKSPQSLLKIKNSCPLTRLYEDILSLYQPLPYEKSEIGKLTIVTKI
jgi:hypothetical protein